MGVNREDFQDRANKTVAPDPAESRELRSGEWVVADGGYGIVAADSRSRYITAMRSGVALETAKEAERFYPLRNHLELFSKFARLASHGKLDKQYETENNAAVALQWTNDHGVLGLTPLRGSQIRPGRLNNPWGGQEDTVAAFAAEAWLAWRVLRLYEAAMDPAGVDAELIADLRGSRETRAISRRALRNKPAASRRAARLIEMSPGELSEWAIDEVGYWLSRQLAAHCYPQPYTSEDGSRKTGSRTTAWGFRSLLGAMWLQMLWLYEREDDQVRRCQWCRRSIEHRAPQARNCEGRACKDKIHRSRKR